MTNRIKYKDEDLIGKRFGRLTVIYIFNKNGDRYAHCKCICGDEKDIRIYDLTSNSTKSCGCYLRDHPVNLIHNLHSHPLYNVLKTMRQRCYNENNEDYKHYGARGIKICREWKNHPKTFINWCVENGWKKGLSIDRIDINGDYSPKNCRFVNQHIQCVNQRLSTRNKSGYKGVSWYKSTKRWISYIRVNGKFYKFGYFKSKKEALEARNKFIIENGLTEYKIQEWKGD